MDAFYRLRSARQPMSSDDVLTGCFECGRKAGWFGPINRYTDPQLLCGYHKRAYTNVVRLLATEPARE